MLTVEYNLRFRVYLAASQQEAKEGLLLGTLGTGNDKPAVAVLPFQETQTLHPVHGTQFSSLVFPYCPEGNKTHSPPPPLGSMDNACCEVPPASGLCVSFRCFQTQLTMVGSSYCCHLKPAVCSGLFQLIHPFGRSYCEGFTAYRYRAPYTHGRVSRQGTIFTPHNQCCNG